MTVEQKLAELGLSLPPAPAPVANYVPYVFSGNHLYISGQISQGADGLIVGKVGQDMDTAAGALAAQACGLSILAQAKEALGGDLSRVTRVVKLTALVNSVPEFTEQPEVINGASNLMAAVFGEKGRHARTAVSTPALPRGVAVEIDAVLEIA